MDQVTIVLLTYNRYDYAEETLRSTLDNVRTTKRLTVHIASDGDTDEYIEKLRHIAGGYAIVDSVGHSNSQRRGYGANYNLAMQTVHPDARYVLPLEDDWRLTRELDLDPLCECLDTSSSIGCIRMGYIGFTQLLCGCLEDVSGSKYLVFSADSLEPHVWAGHPRLEAAVWEREVGPWQEGIEPGMTEFAVCHIPAARRRVAWPLDLIPPRGGLFQHIGAERAR